MCYIVLLDWMFDRHVRLYKQGSGAVSFEN
jgi:hypothetical protein